MHYVPESAREFFQEKPATAQAEDAALADVASLYVLTAVVGLLLAADFLLGTMNLPGAEWYHSPWGYRLALFAAVLGGARILYHSLDNLLAGRVGADLALTTACLAAIALGEYQTAGLVVFISLVGEAIEGFTIQQAKRAIRRTFQQRPQTANLIRNGLEREIAAAELQPGDQVLIRAGDRVPADGRIISGSTSINESPFTGESLPVDKTVNDPVLAGSINLTAAVTVEVTRTGEDTSLAGMERLVRQATRRRMGCERTADRFARWFLPAVLAIAAVTLLAWRWKTGTWQAGWLPALGVLVVACPCPLILATPCAVTAALAWLARRGIVVKGSAALERLSHVDVFAFDKTGTLSEGDLSLGEIIPLADLSAEELLQLAASAERPSNHPIAQLLRTSAAEQKLMVNWPDEFSSRIGAGVMSSVNSQPVLIGSEKLFAEQSVEISAAAREALTRMTQDGQTPLLIAVDGRIAGLIGMKETLRPESAATLRDIKQLGIQRFALLTGDRLLPAQAAGRTLAVFDQIAAEQLPADKAQWIETARIAGQHVAMVGDGVNDAPALAAADVGLAVCRSGSELAGEAGDILLLGDPLRPLPGLIRLSRALVENIRQSIYWFALGVNGIGVLACSFGWLSPAMGALFHEVSSLLVLLNALKLLWFNDQPAVRPSTSLRWSDVLEQWAARLSPGRVFATLIRRWRLTVQLVACGVIAAWLCSQMILVRDDEAVVVLRGGRYHTTLSGGWSWRWPWPWERMIRLRPAAVQTVSVGFRTSRIAAKPASDRQGDLEWTSTHEDPHFRGVPEESLYLTGDEVAVELTADVQYRIGDVQRFALAGALQPEETIRSTSEAVLRSAIASDSLDDVLTERRAEIERRCFDEIRRRIAGYELGIEIVNVHWLDVHPPRPVVDAYRQVSDAWEQREQAVNEAHALATRTLFGTAGEIAIRTLERQHDEPQDGPNSKWSLDDSDWQLLSTPNDDGRRLVSGTAGAILQDAEAAAEKQRQSARGQAERLRLMLAASRNQPELSRQHLYWTAVIEALSGKPFTLIDPALTGRRQLFLGDIPSNVITLPMPPEK